MCIYINIEYWPEYSFKNMFYCTLHFQKKKKELHFTISLTCFNNFNKTDSKIMKNYLHDRDTKWKTYIINFLIYSLYILLNIQALNQKFFRAR